METKLDLDELGNCIAKIKAMYQVPLSEKKKVEAVIKSSGGHYSDVIL